MTTLADIAKAQADYDYAVAQVPILLVALNAAKAAYVPPVVPAPLNPVLTPITVAILNEAQLPATWVPIYIRALADLYAKMKKVGWVLPEITFTDHMVAGSWNFHLSEQNVHGGASGYHGVDPHGIPAAWISPSKCDINRPFGIYHPQVEGSAVPERFLPGILTTLAHEFVEVLADPFIKTISKTADPLGRHWLVEVADHVYGTFYPYFDATTNTWCAMPNITTPNYYGVTGQFDLAGKVTDPWQLTKPAYAFYQDANGHLVQII